jgi:hypothetical protein
VDARAYLRARLLDWWLGDWDRHPEQWRWARIDGKTGGQPLPEDHDHALTHFDGLAVAMLRPVAPWLRGLDADLPMRGMRNSSRWLDAWILAGLGRADWQREIAFFESRIDAAAIDHALAGLPDAWRAMHGDSIRSLLLARLARLRERALETEAELARVVHVQASDADERATLHCRDDGALELSLARRGAEPRLRRTLSPDATHRVVLHLHDGDDRVVRSGGPSCRIEVRVRRGASTRLVRGVPVPLVRSAPQRSRRPGPPKPPARY